MKNKDEQSDPLALNASTARVYTPLRVLLVAILCLCALAVAYALLFPRTTLLFNFTNPNSLKNTLTHPRITPEGELIVHAGVLGEYGSVVLSVEMSDAEAISDNSMHQNTASVRKVYQSFTGPIEKSTETKLEDAALNSDTQEFPSGALLSSSQAIFIRDNDLLRPFAQSETFKSFGYDFDAVLKLDAEQRSAFPKGKLFTLRDGHPVNTIFATTDTDAYFILTPERTLLPIDISESSALINYTVITTQEQSRTSDVTCVLKKHFFFSDRHECTFDLASLKDFASNNYAFAIALDDTDVDTFTQLTATFKRARTGATVTTTVRLLKQRLLQNYETQ